VTKSQQMLGFDSNYVPGWDCHGLPIEWKIEEEYRAKGRDKDKVPIVEFRRECRQFAEHWIGVQRAEFERLGVVGDWEHYYSTMSYAAEAQIARELMKFAANGSLYRGSKPVMWSVVEKTALAEAEVEYEDFVSDQVWVKCRRGGRTDKRRSPGRGRVDTDLDDHALDHSWQSRDQLLTEGRLRPLRGRRRPERQLGEAGRPLRVGGQTRGRDIPSSPRDRFQEAQKHSGERSGRTGGRASA
jgi:hypothetical protein